MRRELRIAGFGGQGVISIGVLLAKAAGQFDSQEVVQTQSYGPEARGGACKTEVILSEEAIDYIKPVALDVFVSMSQPAMDTYQADIRDDSLVIVDSTLVTEVPSRFTNVRRIAATALASEQLGQKVVANVIMFGALAGATDWVAPETCKQALKATFPAKVVEKNFAAFDLGYALAGRGGA